MENKITIVLLLSILCSTSQAYLKVNDFTEVKADNNGNVIECEMIYSLEKDFNQLINQKNLINEQLTTEITNGNQTAITELRAKLEENRRLILQNRLKDSSLKKARIKLDIDLKFSGLSKFMLGRSYYGLPWNTGVNEIKFLGFKSLIQLSTVIENNKSFLAPALNRNAARFSMTQEEFCFSDENNLGAALIIDVEYSYPMETVIISHHIGFDLTKARTAQKQLDDNYTRDQVFENSIKPVVFEIFGLSNFFLINDNFIAALTRKTDFKFKSLLDFNLDYAKYQEHKILKNRAYLDSQGSVKRLRMALQTAKQQLYIQEQMSNEELLYMLTQFNRYKIYSDGTVGAVLTHGNNVVEVIVGKDKLGLFIMAITSNGQTLFQFEGAIDYSTKVAPDLISLEDLLKN